MHMHRRIIVGTTFSLCVLWQRQFCPSQIDINDMLLEYALEKVAQVRRQEEVSCPGHCILPVLRELVFSRLNRWSHAICKGRENISLTFFNDFSYKDFSETSYDLRDRLGNSVRRCLLYNLQKAVS